MASRITIKLDLADALQVLDALESRAEAWTETLRFAQGEDVDSVVEEHKDAAEAEAILTHYRDIIRTIESQVKSN